MRCLAVPLLRKSRITLTECEAAYSLFYHLVSMKILFVHQNFPGQFRHLAPALAANSSNMVVAMEMKSEKPGRWRGVEIVPYRASRGSTPGVHPWLSDFETKTVRAEACFRAALQLRKRGFVPDLVIAHPGWGESLFLKEVWPAAKLALYCEFYYHAEGADVGFDAEFPASEEGDACRLRMKNVNNIMHFDLADAGISPTHWQATTFPEPFRSRITVIHDGIDTSVLVPNKTAELVINKSIILKKGDEVITFVNRNLEPYRGYHIFMRALPDLLRQRPHARVMIVGGDGVSYGKKPEGGRTWKQIYAGEVRPQISDGDWARVHFLGQIPYREFLTLLQLSMVHVYLTYPFVLSWSLLEAMSIGCAIVASNTRPVREAISHDETGRLVDFFDVAGLVGELCSLLDDGAARERLGANARAFAMGNYDLHTVCLPRQLEWVHALGQKHIMNHNV